MDPWTLMAIGAGVGALVGQARGERAKAQAETQRKRDKKRESQLALFSPWHGMAPARVSEKRVDPLDSMMQGLVTGGQLGQNAWYAQNSMDQAGKRDKLYDAQIDWYSRQS